MTITPGTRIGPYEILSPLGAGGMGEVHRARDTQLKREVAIKVLPAAFAADQERVARFRREAELLASLNHPHIAAVYGLEPTTGGSIAIVLELIDGETLAERLARGPMSLDDALAAAAQVAEALEAAHEKGIVHRDLKPANVKIASDGRIKVLDFGLAKLQTDDAAAPGAHLSFSPTITSPPGTIAGVLLGTAAYMSPEQARGLVVDRRTDLFALGCLLFEMISGGPAFRGESVAEILAAVLKEQPDWSALPAGTPGELRRLLRRLLEKDRRRRLQSAGDARIDIEDLRAAPADAMTTRAPAPRRPWWLWGWALGASALLLAALIPLARARFAAAPAPLEMRLEIDAPAAIDLISLALSPDGRTVVASAPDGSLWVRPLDRPGGRLLPGTAGASYPFWSPDSRSLGFFAEGWLKRIDLNGGVARALSEVTSARGGSWTTDGTILFAPATTGPLMGISADGGRAVAVTRPAADHTSHRYPHFLPDGRRFLYFVQGPGAAQGIYLASLDDPAGTMLTRSSFAAAYHPDGWLIYPRDNALVAQRFDPASRALAAETRTVVDSLNTEGGLQSASFSVSMAGVIAYRPGGTNLRQMTWFDRTGKKTGTLGPPLENANNAAEVSLDGTRVSVDRTMQGQTDVWIVDAVRATRLTFHPGIDHWGQWSPDGTAIAFDSSRNGSTHDLYVKASSGAVEERLLLGTAQNKWLEDWSRDGKTLLFGSEDPTTGWDLWYMPADGAGAPQIFLRTPFIERYGEFSPDGRWVAYMSSEPGRSEIYVRAFPHAGGQWQVSTSGGTAPRWHPNGRELFYLSLDATLMSVPLAFARGGVQPANPVPLFKPPGLTGAQSRQQYDVGPDGRILVNAPVDGGGERPVTLLLNWPSEPR